MEEYITNLIAAFFVLVCIFLMWLIVFAGDPIPTWFVYYMGVHAVILIAYAIYNSKNPRYF